jgi:Outer membrane receptor for ferrienterochelin and colicins
MSLKSFFTATILTLILACPADDALWAQEEEAGFEEELTYQSEKINGGGSAAMTLDTLIVTANRKEESLFTTNANVSVISRNVIENSQFTDISQALRTVPGVTISNYANGSVYVSDMLRINGSKDIVVLVDGVRQSNFTAAATLGMEHVERIEVLKGSSSTMWGSAAAGGVINIITREADRTFVSVGHSQGSGLKRDEVYSAGLVSTTGLNIFTTGAKRNRNAARDAHGKKQSPMDYTDSREATFKISQNMDEFGKLTYAYEYQNVDYMYGTQFMGANNNGVPSYGRYFNENYRLFYDLPVGETMDLQLVYHKSKYISKFSQSKDKLPRNPTEEEGYQARLSKRFGDWYNLDLGYEHYETKRRNDRTEAFYILNELFLGPHWRVSGGLRVNKRSKWEDSNNPAFTVSYLPWENLNLYVGYNTFFNTPSTFVQSNSTGIKPEKGREYSAGIKYDYDGRTPASFHFFERRTTDAIYYRQIGGGYQYYNSSSDQTARGWDVSIGRQILDDLFANLSYTHIYSAPEQNLYARNADGMIPRGQVNFMAQYTPESWNIVLHGTGNIDRPGRKVPYKSWGPHFPAETYYIWDLAINKELDLGFSAFFKVNNIFNQYYAERSDVAWGSGKAGWWAMPGRTFEGGLKYTFGTDNPLF